MGRPSTTGPDPNGPAGFTTQWHGHGAGHQANNNPGDTAADRHGFENATAGKSGHKPTTGSAQDDFSGDAAQQIEPHTGLPLIPMDRFAGHCGQHEDDLHDEHADCLF